MRLLFTLLFLSLISAQDANWLRYPAISPNGNTIVFPLHGDLYTVPTSGGKAILLRSHTSHQTKPIWSPDGKWIAFASDQHGNFDVFVMPAMGGPATRLTFNSSGEMPESFTPDGKNILFTATIMDDKKNQQFPTGVLPELYQIPAKGGRVERVMTTPGINAVYNKAGDILIYTDRKGYENIWRKHHTSSIARDVWMHDTKTGSHTMLSNFAGEDRNPVFSPDEKSVFFLSEKSGSLNIVKKDLASGSISDVSKHKTHPVRFLTISNDGTMAYSYHGNIYTIKDGQTSSLVKVKIPFEANFSDIEHKKVNSGAQGVSVSSNGKEVAFIHRGDVFVTSIEYSTTKQITKTSEQERSVSFSPDGRSLVYAGERNGSWNIYQTSLSKKSEKYFHNAMYLKETLLVNNGEETFQPDYSPDGKEVAFLENRTTLRVINLKSEKIRTVMDGKYSYSYSDGDQWYQWSPDSKWFLVNYFEKGGWLYSDVGLVDASGKKAPVNMSNSGYSDNGPKWAMNGKALMWYSDRYGMRSHGSWGSTGDIYAMFFTQESYDEFLLSKEEAELAKDAKKDDKKSDKKDDKKDKKAAKVKSLKLDLEGIEDRKVKLTVHSSAIADAYVLPDGSKLFYLARFEKGFNLWVQDFKENSTTLVLKLNSSGSALTADKDGKNLFIVNRGSIVKIDTKSNKQKRITFNAEMTINHAEERAYMFEHAWRQVKEKFYDPKIHGLDWDYLKKEYAKLLPQIKTNYDFAEFLSEILGELNASHTGSGYRAFDPNGDQTASLGVIYDYSYKGKGVKIDEIVDKSPLLKSKSKAKVGDVIERVDGETIEANMNYEQVLNRKVNKKVLITFYRPSTKKRWDETVKTISGGSFGQLLYERWVKNRKEMTEKLSGGKIGYVHVRGMNSASFREVYSEVLGRYRNKEGIIVDTRFNGGGWLHDDLATFLNGKKYAEFKPRGQYIGDEPANKWTKKSAVLISESNYSDAHGFPFAYRALGVGKTIGMPVPGTMTAVWWETLIDRSLYFGIPQVTVADLDGRAQENFQFEPDIKVNNDYESVAKGKDKQLEKAVEVLLNEK